MIKRQRRTTTLAILVDLPSPIICAKIRAMDLVEEEYLKGVYHILAEWPSWPMDRDHFSKGGSVSVHNSHIRIRDKCVTYVYRCTHT